MSGKNISQTECRYCVAKQAYIDGIVALATIEHEELLERANKLRKTIQKERERSKALYKQLNIEL